MSDPSFFTKKLSEAGAARNAAIANMFDALYRNLKAHCPEGREFAIVRTKLEEACMFAKKSMITVVGNTEEG